MPVQKDRYSVFGDSRTYHVASDIFPCVSDEGEMIIWMVIELCPINGLYVMSHHETREDAVEALDALFA